MSLVTGQTGGTNSQFTFNAETGTITLNNNGRKFAVEITEDGETKRLGADSKELLTLVQSILDHIGQEKDITFEDLSNTSITVEGVKTDQKEVSEGVKTYKDMTYSQQYAPISEVAHKTFSKLPKLSVSSALSQESSESTGKDPRKPGEIIPKQVRQFNKDDEGALELTVSKTDKTAVVSFSEEGVETKNESIPLPQEKKGVKKVWSDFLDWLSRNNWLSNHIDELGRRNPATELEANKAKDLLAQTEEQTERDSDIVDQEGRYVFSHILLPISNTSEANKYDLSALTIDQLERIVTQTVQVNGKVKIRNNAGQTEIRAGHRAGKAKAREKKIGTSEPSREAMNVMLEAMKGHLDKFMVPYRQYTILSSLNDLKEKPKDIGDWAGPALDDLIDHAKALRSLFVCDELNDFIDAMEAFKDDRQSEDKCDAFNAKLGELVIFLNKTEDSDNTRLQNYINAIDKKVDQLNSEHEKLESSFALLTLHTTWGKAVLENDSDGLGAKAKNLSKELNDAKSALNRVTYGIHPDRKSKDTQWVAYDEFKDSLFEPDNQDVRAEFVHAYRWVMPSEKYIGMLRDRYQANKENIEDAEDPELTRLKSEQRIILEMVADWAELRRVNDKEIDTEVSDGNTIKDVIEALADDIKEEVGFADIYQKIVKGVNPDPVVTIDPKNSNGSFKDDLEKISKGSMGKKERKEFVTKFRKQFTIMAVNSMLDIQHAEFAKQGWSKPTKMETSPNLLRSIGQFNNVSNYFQLLIMTVEDPQAENGRRNATVDEQAEMINFLIDVQNEAIAKGDLNLAMAVQSAFGSSSISRLSEAWSHKTLKKKNIQNSINTNRELLDPSQSFAKMREYMAQHTDAVPYLGVTLQDITFSDDGQKTFRDADAEGTEINTFKLKLLQGQIQKVLRFQTKQKKTQPDFNLLAAVQTANAFAQGDGPLYALSLKVQPRVNTQ